MSPFVVKQPRLARHAAAVAAQLTVTIHDSVAGNDEGKLVRAIRLRDRSHRCRSADHTGDFSVAARFTGWDCSERLQVSAFLPGDRVYGAIGHQGGANADYACVKQSRVTLAPAPLAFGELAAVPVAGLTALQALRSVANLQEGQRVLVSGASGGVGAFAVQLAKRFGGTVTGVCSGAKRDFVESLGAFDTIDYQKDDFSQRSERWDIIFDASGKRDFAELQRVLSDEGRAVSTRLSPRGALNAVTSKLGVAPRYHFIPARERSYDLAFLARLIERGELRVPLDRTFELKDLPEAHRYMEAGEVCGKVVVKVV